MGGLITVGLPFYNDRRHLAQAIRSVLRQTEQNWELLLVSDGSNDGSLEIARSFQDPRIRVLDHRDNRGLTCRLNEIAGAARGEYLFRMDADDVMHPERLAKQGALLRRSPANTVVGTAAIEMDEAGHLTRIIRSRGASGGGYSARRAFIHPTVAARTVWFRENPYADAPVYRRTQDAELWIRTAGESKFVLMDEPLLFYRRPGRMSFDKYLWQALALVTILATSPASGGAAGRFFHCAEELLKLQVRFGLHVLTNERAEARTLSGDNPQLANYRQILDALEN